MFPSRFLFLAVAIAASAWAAEDLQTGDLIFHTSKSRQATAIVAASDSPYSHVGILEVTGNEVFVIEAINPVSRTPFKKWIERGVGAKWATYRDVALTPDLRLKLVAAARKKIGVPYDVHFTSNNREIYCSELVYLAYQSLGITVGKMQPLKSLKIDSQEVQALAQQRWMTHPRCKHVKTFGACWALMLDDLLITPASLANDPRFKKIHSY